jgi:hypothetical protein
MDESSYKQMQDGAYAPPKATTTATAVAYAEGQPVAYANPNYMPTAVAVPYDAGMGGVVTVVYVADAPIPQKMDFLRKVFFTLSAQLLVTFAIVLMFYIPGCNPVSPNMSINGSLLNCTGDSLHTIVSNSSWIIWVTLVAWLVLYVVCVCTQPVCRNAPVNYIILFTFTLGTGIFLGVLSCYSSLVEVVLAVALTLLISISLIVLTRLSFVNGFVGPAPFVAVAVMASAYNIMLSGRWWWCWRCCYSCCCCCGGSGGGSGDGVLVEVVVVAFLVVVVVVSGVLVVLAVLVVVVVVC